MRFVIGTASSDLHFDNDLKLIKSALLYADDVQLLGMAEYAVFIYIPQFIKTMGESKDLEELLKGILPFINSIDVEGSKELQKQINILLDQLQPYRYLMRGKKRHNWQKEELIAREKLKKTSEDARHILSEQLEMITGGYSNVEIGKLIDNHIISVYDYGDKEFNVNKLAGGYFGNLLSSVVDQTAYPLFDEVSANLLKAAANTHLFDISQTNEEMLRHAGVASSVLMTLPTLEHAGTDEILDFKKQNEKPLIHFRKAVYDFSEQISSLPWDDNFQYDCLKIYHSQVQPAVEEINELTSETSTLKNFGKKVLEAQEIRKNAKWVTSGIATAVITNSSYLGALDSLKQFIIPASLITISPQLAEGFMTTAQLFMASKEETKEKKKQVQGNSMYYYYLAGRRLGKKK